MAISPGKSSGFFQKKPTATGYVNPFMHTPQLNVACASPLIGAFHHRKLFFRLVNCSKGQLKWRQYRDCCYLKTLYEIIRRPHPSLRATTNNGREMTTVSRKSYTVVCALAVDCNVSMVMVISLRT